MSGIDPNQVILSLRRLEQPEVPVFASPDLGIEYAAWLAAMLVEHGPPAIGFLGLDPGKSWYTLTPNPDQVSSVRARTVELDGATLRIVPSTSPRDPWVALILEPADSAQEVKEEERTDPDDRSPEPADASQQAPKGSEILQLHTGLLRRAGLESAPALRAAGIVDDHGRLSLGAQLFLARYTEDQPPPGWTLVVERYHTDPRTVERREVGPAERRTLEPPLTFAIDAIVDDLSVEPPFLHRDSGYAAHALREVLVNAIVHRTYSGREDEPVRVFCYPDRVVIDSPGAWAGPEDEQGEPRTDPSASIPNPDLHALMARLGLCRQQGMGLERARMHARAIGMRLEIDHDDEAVWVSLIADRQLSLEMDAPGADRETTMRKPATVREDRVLEYLRRRESASKKEIAEVLEIPQPTVAVTIKNLRAKGLVMTTEKAARSPRQRYRAVKDRT